MVSGRATERRNAPPLDIECLGGNDEIAGSIRLSWSKHDRHRAIAAGAFATQSGRPSLGVIRPERDGVNLVTGVNRTLHRPIPSRHSRQPQFSPFYSPCGPTGNKPGSRGRNQDIAGSALPVLQTSPAADLTAGEQPHLRIDAVFDRQDTRRQRVRVSSSRTATAPCIRIRYRHRFRNDK